MMKLLFIEKDENGKVDITQEKIQELVDEAYKEGYNDGQQHPWILPDIPNTTPWYETPLVVTCNGGLDTDPPLQPELPSSETEVFVGYDEEGNEVKHEQLSLFDLDPEVYPEEQGSK